MQVFATDRKTKNWFSAPRSNTMNTNLYCGKTKFDATKYEDDDHCIPPLFILKPWLYKFKQVTRDNKKHFQKIIANQRFF